jgi:hypothetical protein
MKEKSNVIGSCFYLAKSNKNGMILIEIEPFPVVQPTPLKLKLTHINLLRSTQHGNIT